MRVLVIIMEILMMVLPPPLPSSFYGYVDAPVGTPVIASIHGIVKGQTVVTNWEDQSVYSINVQGGEEGDTIVFTVGEISASTAVWHSGTNVRLDLVILDAIVTNPPWITLVPMVTSK